MRFLRENAWTLATLFLAVFLGMTGNVWAQTSPTGSTIVETATTKVGKVFDATKTIIFVIAGFGLVGLAWAAIFKKVDFKWLAALATGLAILAAAGAIVEYATGSSDADGYLETTFGRI